MNELEALKPVPTDFASKISALTWRDALWGYEHGWLGWRSLVELANSPALKVGSSDELAALAACDKDDSHKAGELARSLAASENPKDDESLKKKWLLIVLAWLHHRRDDVSDVWRLVEVIYAEFDYPKVMEGFVPYMPMEPQADDGLARTPQERMLRRWEKALVSLRSQVELS